MSSQDAMQQQIQRATVIQEKYGTWLMNFPNVIGVGVGFTTQNDTRLGDVGLVVMVDHKVPEDQLQAAEILPKELEGVKVDVQEGGFFTAQ